jgi:phospholipase C
MQRRDFLRGALALGGATALASRVPAWARSPERTFTDSTLNHQAADCPVDTIVVLMMENRSFDHYFAWLATDAVYLDRGRRRYGSGFRVDGRLHHVYRRGDGTEASTYHLTDLASGEVNPYRGCGHPDPSHGWESGRVQRDDGFVAAGSGNDDYSLGYYLAGDLPCYEPLVRSFTTFDRSFCSLMTGTYPNRYYLHAAQGDGSHDGRLPGPDQLGFPFATIWDRLIAAGVPCRYYGTDVPVTGFWGPRLLPITRQIADFFADAAAGQLPNVVYLDPGFLSGMRTDDHPNGDMRIAQSFVASIVRALQSSPQWGRLAFITTYDEWGGFHDHVRPPVLPDDRASTIDADNYGQAGFRVPTMLISPFARPGWVDHRVYDHTSTLRFIEWRFLGAPPEGPQGSDWWLTTRDRNANNIGASLADHRINDVQLDLPSEHLAVSLPCDSQWFQDVPVLSNGEDQLMPTLHAHGVDLDPLSKASVDVTPPNPPVDPHPLEQAAPLIQSYGYRVEPSMTLTELLTAG